MWEVIVKHKITGDVVAIPCESLELAKDIRNVVAYEYTVDLVEKDG